MRSKYHQLKNMGSNRDPGSQINLKYLLYYFLVLIWFQFLGIIDIFTFVYKTRNKYTINRQSGYSNRADRREVGANIRCKYTYEIIHTYLNILNVYE